jgi:arylsulfatase A-like enzyme
MWLLAALWAGIVTGLAEGVGLWAFQRINWARWGPMIHVSPPIIWISPIVDVSFFVLVALIAWVTTRLIQRSPSIRVLAFLLAYFAAYDWLTLTGRIYHVACILFAVGAGVAFSRWLGTHPPHAVKFLRKSLPAALALYLIALGGIEGHRWWSERAALAALPPAAPNSPNVLVIVIDTLRADHVSAYGYSRPTTPNLDRLAKEGVLFENAISPSSWSLPSHASLVTGRYMHDHKVGNVQPEPWFGWGKSSLGGLPTIGEVLEKRGYRTGAFSANRTYFSKDLGFGRGFIHFEDYFNSVGDAFVRTLYGREFARLYLNRSNKSKITKLVVRLGGTSLLDKDSEGDAAYGGAQAIRKHSSTVNGELLRWIDEGRGHRPFFAFLNYFDVHYPYGAPRNYPAPEWAERTSIDSYDAGLKYVDDCLGKLLSALQARNIDKNTLVIITSDHGESLGQHGLRYHGASLYWEEIRVPLVVWLPGHVPMGLTVQEPVSNAEIPSTIMAILGADQRFPGPDLSMSWKSHATEKHPDPLSEEEQNRYLSKADLPSDAATPTVLTGWMKCLVSAPFHLIVHEKRGAQLYDVQKDSGELKNLAETPAGQQQSITLERHLDGNPSTLR